MENNVELQIKARAKKNSRIATKILIAFTIVFLITYPFHRNFFLGLISSMCCASMIGGLADWFAVTALFRKPLGSNILASLFRTQIIPKNRERIFEALVDMVQNELLTKENIKAKLKDFKSSEVVIELIKAKNIKELDEFFNGFLSSLLDKLKVDDLNKFEKLSEAFVKENLKNVEITEIIRDSVIWMTENGYDEQLIEILIDKLEDITKTNEVNVLIQNILLQVLEMNRGNFLIMIMGFVIKSNIVEIAFFFQKMLIKNITSLKDKENPQRDKLRGAILKYTEKLETDEALKLKIETFKLKVIEENEYVYNKVSSFIHKELEKLKNSKEENNLVKEAVRYLEEAYQRFAQSNKQQDKFNDYIRTLLAKIVDTNHDKIGKMVKSKLDGISGEGLSLMIEPIIWGDLQLIRVNGSIVGGMVGVLTYLLTFWIK